MNSFSTLSAVIVYLIGYVSGQCIEHTENERYYGVLDLCDTHDWALAREYCQTEFDTDLAIIHSVAENRLAYQARNAFDNGESYDAWIGLSDIDDEDEFIWVDGSDVTYTAWFSGEPNNYMSNQDCVIMGSGSIRWDDQDCM